MFLLFSEFNMKTYRDVFSGDELFSDTYKVSLVDNMMYEVLGKYKSTKEDKVVLEGNFGFCADYEATTSGIDIILNHKLVNTGFGEKKNFSKYLMCYREKVLKYLEENDRTAEIDEFKSNINNVMKEMMGKFKDLQFFTGKTIQIGFLLNFLFDLFDFTNFFTRFLLQELNFERSKSSSIVILKVFTKITFN